jgi:sec-independent protein translocase protein TatC
MDAALPRQAFSEHIRELRSRLLWVAATLAVAATVAYQFHTILQRFLLSPLRQPVFYTSPTGGLSFVIKICLYFGVLISVPVLVYHVIRFLEPLLPSHKRRQVVLMTSASGLLLLTGVSFAYYIALPVALHFFGTFSTTQIRSLISTNEYLSFALIYLVGFGLIFQIPLVLLIVNRITPLRPRKLMGLLRYVVVVSLILAAVLTPTLDLINQTLLAAPVIILYLLSVFLIWLINRKAAEPIDESSLWSEFAHEATGIGLMPEHKHRVKEAPAQNLHPKNPNLLDLRRRE